MIYLTFPKLLYSGEKNAKKEVHDQSHSPKAASDLGFHSFAMQIEVAYGGESFKLEYNILKLICVSVSLVKTTERKVCILSSYD